MWASSSSGLWTTPDLGGEDQKPGDGALNRLNAHVRSPAGFRDVNCSFCPLGA